MRLGRGTYRLLGVVGLAAPAMGAGCLLTVDLESLQSRECPANEKLCGEECISKLNPQTGCASQTCLPCGLSHAVANCTQGGQCAIAACIGGYRNCDGDPANGCEIDIDHDALHCGSCTAQPCVMPNATPDCGAGLCAIRTCHAGFGDCNQEPRDGCETDLKRSAAHCSKCGTPCAEPSQCLEGQCR